MFYSIVDTTIVNELSSYRLSISVTLLQEFVSSQVHNNITINALHYCVYTYLLPLVITVEFAVSEYTASEGDGCVEIPLVKNGESSVNISVLVVTGDRAAEGTLLPEYVVYLPPC